ncbi:hypothetical protein [Corynebacterium gerontici]|uniref:Glycosyltransferase RgtA/B/C/D-like domain-containing protein n=1 Tax=Corynebacterium gerontici TaxID=2079234 RepID=A0A3G6J358_9CORY|nr:hypothetical protein [Corynebacterium gerontici]AZA10544.1 hypothetical protein CGERO_01045 [Corynebacterium gerontici]
MASPLIRWPVLWSALLITLLLWPFATPGMLGLRDMVVVPHPAVSFGDLPARNFPQDGILAVLGKLFDASYAARLMLLAGAIAGAYGASRFGQRTWGKIAAITLCLCNPFTIERLHQGHWSLVIAAWLLPLLVATKNPLVLWACSLTPTGAVIATVVGVATGPWKKMLLVGALSSLSWLVPSLQSVPGSSTHAYLASHTGNIWNAEVAVWLPMLALFGLLLLAPRRLQILAWSGLILMLAIPWLLWLPGASLFRDSNKLLMLALPAMVAGAARIPPLALVFAALSFRPLPDVTVPTPDLPQSEGDLLIVDSRGIVEYQGRVMVDPRLKANSSVQAGELRVDGEITDQASPRYTEALKHLDDDAWLREHHIGLVIDGDSQREIGGITKPHPLGWALIFSWFAVPMICIKRRPVSSQENCCA